MLAQRAPNHNDRRKNSPTVYRDGTHIAGIRFGDVLRSTRGTAGIHYATNAILWSESVLRAAASDIATLEVITTDKRGRSRTYRTPLATMMTRGTLCQTAAGTQRGLPLGEWETDADPEPQPAPQLALFGGAA